MPTTAPAALIETAFEQLDDQAGCQFLRLIGQRLIAPTLSFDPHNRGCAKRVTLIEKIDAFGACCDGVKVYTRPPYAA